MKNSDRQLLGDALSFALDAHGDQTRKGTDIPYVSHLLQVAGLVLEHGGDAEQAAAALLHDVVEDCDGVTSEDLRARFRPRVADIVSHCTDTMEGDQPGEKLPWRRRKEVYLEQLPSADDASLLVCVCDKRHNLAALVSDLRSQGVETLGRFNASGPDQVWYFESVLRVAHRRIPASLRRDFEILLAEFKEFVDGSTRIPG